MSLPPAGATVVVDRVDPARRRVVNGATVAPHELPDRLTWRVRLKANPVTRGWFRVAVAVVGFALIIAAPLTGWLPGPGGIPLFLTGIAVLATEFLWAKSLRRMLMRRVGVYLSWSANRQRLFWVCFAVCFGLVYYTVLLVSGVPSWAPAWLSDWLRLLPGVS